MKKATSLLLVLTMVLSLLSGCGKPAAQESAPQVPATAPIAETAAPTTEPTTEPTLSPEELLYNSLTDRQRQAVDVGIVELSQMEDLERECTIGEAARMVQNARVQMYGEESAVMAAAMESSQKELPVTRYWLIQAMYISAVEQYNTPPFTDYYSNLSYMTWGADPELIFIELAPETMSQRISKAPISQNGMTMTLSLRTAIGQALPMPWTVFGMTVNAEKRKIWQTTNLWSR